MKPNVQSIVEELLTLEPSLADRRTELETMVKELLAHKPETRFRPAFQQELLGHIRERMAERKDAPLPTSSFFSLMNSRFLFAGGGAVLGALLVFVVLQQPFSPSPAPSGDSPYEPASVEELANNAFGSLATSEMVGGRGGGGGGGDAAGNFVRPESGGGGMAVEGDEAKLIAPDYEFKQTQYVFDGEISLPEGDIEVYKRIKPDTKIAAGNSIAGFASGMINWSALGSMNIQNVNLVTTGNTQYSVYIDYNEGNVSVSRIYKSSEQPWYNCQDDNCYQRYRLKESDMLSEEEAVSIAQNFVNKLGIDMSNYGDPIMQDDWRYWLEQTADRSSYYFPDQTTVIFPMMIDGKPVYEEYGNVYGVSIGVDVRKKEGMSMYNYAVQNFQKSSYDVVSDEQKVRDALKRGSIYYWLDQNATYVDAQLGEPTMAYMHHYLWDQKTSTSSELFVPALVFPVTQQAEGMYDNRKNVVVPLADELLQNNNNGGDPIPLPRPLPVDLETEEAAG